MRPAPGPRDTTLYFALALTITNVVLLPPALAALGFLRAAPEDLMAGAPIAIIGPTIAAVIATRREGLSVRELFAGLGAWRVAPMWFVVALTLPALACIAGHALYVLVGGSEELPWLMPPGDAQRAIGAVLVPLGEEIGWRGYALPRLIARHGPLHASVILGLLWALWHTCMMVMVGTPWIVLMLMPIYFVAGSVMFTWLYRRTGGSLLLAVLLHVGAHLHNTSQSASPTPTVLATASFTVLAVLLVVFDRASFGRGTAFGAS
jgi:membrane protease YdiL (CAAX protease family)